MKAAIGRSTTGRKVNPLVYCQGGKHKRDRGGVMTDGQLTRKIANIAKEYIGTGTEADDMLLELGTRAEIQAYIKRVLAVETDDEPQRTMELYALSHIDWPLFWEVIGLDKMTERARKLVAEFKKSEREKEAMRARGFNVW